MLTGHTDLSHSISTKGQDNSFVIPISLLNMPVSSTDNFSRRRDRVIEAAVSMVNKNKLYHEEGLDMGIKESVNELVLAVEDYVEPVNC